MMKKYAAIILILHFLLISCSRVEIISDPYWNTLISDFKGKAVGLKFQAFINGKSLNLTVADIKGGIPDLRDFTASMSDVYLISPLLSQSVSSLGETRNTSVFYYFDITNRSVNDRNNNMIVIERDRRKAFFDAGRLVSKEMGDDSFLPIVFDVDNSVQKEEADSFLDGIGKSGRNISIVSLEINSTTSEVEIRSFFNKESVKNYTYMVIFTDKWKNICYELSERDGKKIITSDSWFSKTYEPLIVLSIEDNIKGMLKKVYNNIKTGKHTDIILDGYINR